MVRLYAVALLVAVGLGTGCLFQARECCECMATKDLGFFGDCLTETVDVCVEQLTRDPPNVDVVREACRADEENGYCTESCADIFYRN
ncbi:MAG: hypothetical protein JXR83_20855 [Deltaproteobacteria bacterium]|nr:hypothetical protein [Deltaproteobacteria bacterium]